MDKEKEGENNGHKKPTVNVTGITKPSSHSEGKIRPNPNLDPVQAKTDGRSR